MLNLRSRSRTEKAHDIGPLLVSQQGAPNKDILNRFVDPFRFVGQNDSPVFREFKPPFIPSRHIGLDEEIHGSGNQRNVDPHLPYPTCLFRHSNNPGGLGPPSHRCRIRIALRELPQRLRIRHCEHPCRLLHRSELRHRKAPRSTCRRRCSPWLDAGWQWPPPRPVGGRDDQSGRSGAPWRQPQSQRCL